VFKKPWQRKLFLFWELPQYILGIFFILFLNRRIIDILVYKDAHVFIARNFPGGISLIIILNESEIPDSINESGGRLKCLLHEYGHSIQSFLLGWLYLPLVGIPSVIRAAVWKNRRLNPALYYKRYPESWADKLTDNKKYS